MNTRANPLVVGAFVIGALLLVVIAVVMFGSGAVLRERIPVVAFFAGNVRGLQEGSAVEFRGVRVGTVKRIRLLLDVNTQHLLIPVHMELEPRSLRVTGASRASRKAGAIPFLEELVAQGLRARLDLKSFVTGQLAVGLDMLPDTKINRVGAIADVYEIPTVASTVDRLLAMLRDLPLQDIALKLIDTLDSASRLLDDEHLAATLRDAAGAAADTRKMMSELQAKLGPAIDEARVTMSETRTAVTEISQHTTTTLEQYARLAQDVRSRLSSLAIKTEQAVAEFGAIRASLDARVAPISDSAVAALGEARAAMVNARNILAEDSHTHYNLDVALEELAAAARSLRIMADYLEQNPDALLKGRR